MIKRSVTNSIISAGNIIISSQVGTVENYVESAVLKMTSVSISFKLPAFNV